MSLYVINVVRKLTTALYGQHKIYCGCSVNYIHDRPVVRFQLYRLYVCALRDVRTYIYIHVYIYIYTSKRYSVGARLSGRTTDGLYVLLCRYIRSQAAHRYISRSAASYEEPISSYSLELK